MKREAAGFVLFRSDGDVLLLHSRKNQEWGFPKGHRDDADEDLLVTARRELEEETGIQGVEALPGFEHVLNYRVRKGVHGSEAYDKRVVYYLARCSADTDVKLSKEHDDFRWCKVDQARELLGFEDLRRTLDAAQSVLEKRGS